MSRALTIAKHFITIGAGLAFIPLMVALYFFRDSINGGTILIRMLFIFAGLVIVYLVVKIIMKFIHREEEEKDVDTKHLVDVGLFGGITNMQIVIGLGFIVGILIVSLIPTPWNIFLMLAGFYVMFTMLRSLV